MIQKSFQNIRGLRDNWTKIFPRKEEVKELLSFFQNDRKDIFVIGPGDIGRTYTISRAIKFAVEHEFEALQDGAFYIDLADLETI